MFRNNEVTEGLLIVVIGVNYVLLFFIRWHVATARLYLRQARRLAIAIGKMNCDEQIAEILLCSGGMAEQQRYEVTASDNLASPRTAATPDAVAEQQPDQKAPGRVQKYRERLALVAAVGQAGRYGLLAHGKAFTASHGA